jgi:glycosyltransferase involved in cell wall biosynthesis
MHSPDPAVHVAPPPLRVLIVASNFPPSGWGGAEVAADGIGRWLLGEGHRVAVYTDAERPAGPEASGREGYAWFGPDRRAFSHRTHEHAGKSAARKAIWHLRDHVPGGGGGDFARVAEAFGPDVVMVHLAPGLGIGLFEVCAERDIPVVFVLHDFWLTCLRSSMFTRGGSVCEGRELLCWWSSSVRWGALSKVTRLGFWAPSRRIVEILRGQLGDVFGNLLVQKNVVDLADFRGRERRTPEGKARFLFVGKVTEAKGIGFLLDCLASLPAGLDFQADIVGGGDSESRLRRLHCGERRFRFHGVCGREAVVRHYHEASVLVVPSLWFENSPLVVYQAQAAGLPVIGSDSGGIPELLEDRAGSRILPAGDRDAWVSCLSGLASDPGSLRRMREEALRQADGGGEVDSLGRAAVEFCRQLVSGARPVPSPQHSLGIAQ